MIVLTYMDDCLIFSDEKEKMDCLLDNLRQTFKLTDESEDVKAYLGTNVQKTSNGTITMTQPALIQQILQALELNGDNVRTHYTPANMILFKDNKGNPRLQSWKQKCYRYADVRGDINTARYCICSAPMCKIQHRSTKMPRRSSQTNWEVSKTNNG